MNGFSEQLSPLVYTLCVCVRIKIVIRGKDDFKCPPSAPLKVQAWSIYEDPL